MSSRPLCFKLFGAMMLAAICAAGGFAQNVKRVVVVKVDGLPAYYVDQFVKQRDPVTGRSVLPWFDEIFYKNGSRVGNFYTRGISLSAPSWSMLDTGQHLQIKGNIEYDRLTKHGYDYLYIVPYYVRYLFKKKADMPAVEVLDQMSIPLMCDAFPYNKRYTAQQLYQRGNSWENLASGFVNLYPGKPKDFVDEWSIGLDFLNLTINQAERDVVDKVVTMPELNYLDYFTGYFDHVSHANNDTASRLAGLKALDRTIGRMWVAIQSSSRADETAMILVSDHGFNSEEKIYSQGFNLVNLFRSAPGGGHHVVTKQRMMSDYSIKAIYPFLPIVTNESKESFYLKGQNDLYPTALVDLDGNERASIHLRQNDLNILQILLQQLKVKGLSQPKQKAATDLFFQIVDKYRKGWQTTAAQLGEEMDALHRSIEKQEKVIAAQPDKFTPEDFAHGIDKEARRVYALAELAKRSETDYRKYIAILNNLIGLKRETLDPKKLKIEDLIAPEAMGEQNSVFDLQNYVVGLSPNGLALNADQSLDLEKSFRRVDYLDLLYKQKVRSNVQAEVSSRPVDFTATRIPQDALAEVLPSELRSSEDAIWLYGGFDKQALILTRVDADGGQSYRYMPISALRQDASGKVTFTKQKWAESFPLKYFEDQNLAVSDREAWINDWHNETEWLRATHKTIYSNAIIGLNEQIDRHKLPADDDADISAEGRLMRRFRQRQRDMTQADMLVLAANHWNFNVASFNPGGNHGSYFRVSTNSTLMFAGGAKTGIPRGLLIEEPYDNLSFMPTVLRLMGKVDDQGRPTPELVERGFHTFPGRMITEVTKAR
ncbi:MAG: alkaline phosphatase family protein [Pyrinomonadaceae bacterium]